MSINEFTLESKFGVTCKKICVKHIY